MVGLVSLAWCGVVWSGVVYCYEWAAIRTLCTLQPAAIGTAKQALDWLDSAPDIYKKKKTGSPWKIKLSTQLTPAPAMFCAPVCLHY